MKFELVTLVAAPLERCFDLSLSIDLHQHAFGASGERAVAGVTAGLIGPDESVTWEATHFGVRQRLTSRITIYDRPRHFRDSMVSGAFRRFDHDHWFTPHRDGGTMIRDVFDFEAPLGVLGRLAEATFLTRYMRRLLAERNAVVKRVAESEEWRRFLGGSTARSDGDGLTGLSLRSFCEAAYGAYTTSDALAVGPDGAMSFAATVTDGGHATVHQVRFDEVCDFTRRRDDGGEPRPDGPVELSVIEVVREADGWRVWLNPWYVEEIEFRCARITLDGREVTGTGRWLQDDRPRPPGDGTSASGKPS